MIMISRPLSSAAVFFLAVVGFAAGQQPSDDVAVGQDICTYGYIMDEYCIDLGKLLDAQSVATLENPEEHSVHCLVDVPRCYETPFHVLTEPSLFSGDTTYGPGWAVSDNTVLLTTSRALGDSSCTTCEGGGAMKKGLRMEVRGTVVTLDPPVIDLVSAGVLEEGMMGCKAMEEPATVEEEPAMMAEDAAAATVAAEPTSAPAPLDEESDPLDETSGSIAVVTCVSVLSTMVLISLAAAF